MLCNAQIFVWYLENTKLSEGDDIFESNKFTVDSVQTGAHLLLPSSLSCPEERVLTHGDFVIINLNSDTIEGRFSFKVPNGGSLIVVTNKANND